MSSGAPSQRVSPSSRLSPRRPSTRTPTSGRRRSTRKTSAAAHDDGIAQVVAAAACDAERLAEDGPRKARRRDGEDPEEGDDGARVIVAAEHEAHDGDEHDGAEAGRLRDVPPLAEVRPEAERTVEVEGLEGE